MRKKNKILQSAVLIGVIISVCGCQSETGATSATGTTLTGTENTDMAVQAAENLDRNGADTYAGGADLKTGDSGNDREVGAAAEAAQMDNSADSFVYMVDGVEVAVDMDMDELAAKLGESKSIFEAPSCAGEGISYIYNYTSYEIETYPATDGKNRIGYIILRDDTTATAEGIDLSMTKEDVIRAYGEDCEEGENRVTYEKNGAKLNFIFDGDDIISIEYVSAVIG